GGQQRRLCWLHAAQLRVALRLYQAEQGRPAERLTQLVPRYLSDVPRDPFDDQPFRYRLSRGEEIRWPEEPKPPKEPPEPVALAHGAAAALPGALEPVNPTRKVPAGQGVLWSIGEDGHDDGGVRQAERDTGRTQHGEDIIFLVPLPARK